MDPKGSTTSARVFALYCLLGFGLLLPWNVILSCIPAFRTALPPGAGYFAPSRYAFFAPLAFNSPQLPMQLLQLCLGARAPSARARLLAGYSLQAVLLVALPFSVALGMGYVLAGCVLSGAATAVLESALFGAAGSLGGAAGAEGVRAILVGEGIAALLATLLQLALHAEPALGQSQWVVRAYFLAAGVVMLVCLGALPYALGLGAGAGADSLQGASSLNDSIDSSEEEEEDSGAPLLDTQGQVTWVDLDAPHEALLPAPAAATTSLQLLVTVWPTALAIFLAMFISFLVFPGALSDAAYVGSGSDFFSQDPAAWSLLLYLLFNGGDLVGRWAAGLPWCSLGRAGGWCTSQRSQALAVAAYNALRAAFLPLFYVASRPGGAARVPGGPVMLCMAVLAFGFTNGHAATLAMVAGGQLVEAAHRNQVAALHVLCLIAGLWAGAAGGLVFAPSAA